MKSARILLLPLLLSACTLGPNYHRSASSLPKVYGEKSATQGEPVQKDWWKLFHDPVLDNLIDTALKNNADLRVAAAKIEEADAQLRVVGAALFPEFDLGGGGTRTKPSQATGVPVFGQSIRNSLKINLNTTFELDFWGKLRRADEAARAQALSTVYGKATVEIALVSLVTQSYLSLRSLDSQIASAKDSLAARNDALAIYQSREAAGLQSDIDVASAENLREQAKAQLSDLEASRALLFHQLAFLCGKPDLAVAPGEFGRLPTPPAPPAGLPSNLLEARPDVRQAEEALVAANANIGFAKAALFPSITLTGSFGGESKSLSDIARKNAEAWTFGLGLTLPVFDAGKRRALVDQSSAQMRQALISYQKSLQNAFKEVDDALSNLDASTTSETAQKARAMAAEKAFSLATARENTGYSPYLDTLSARIARNDAEIAFAAKRATRLSSTVDLFRALGGGWRAASQ